MSSALISAEITATCNALGDANKSTKYILGPHCKESAKDLIKYLRRDDETHSIRRQLGDTNVVHTDLIPIIIHFSDNEELFDIILRLLVNLTTPAMILYNEEIPGDKVVRQLYHQIISHLQKYKIAFANEALWKILRTQLTSILNIPRAERTEEKNLVAERIIILIRNVLQIPTDPETERCCHDNPNSHDTVVYVLNQAGMLDILIYIAMSPDESNYYLHLLEIMMLLLKEQNPESLAKSDRTRTTTEKQKDENELNRIREREVKEKAERLMKYSSRHSRFGGTYVVKGVKGIGDKDVLVHKPITNLEDITFDKDKRPTKTPKNRAPLKDNRLEHRSPLSVRIILRGFCEEFLQAYNNVMRGVRESISRDKAQANDETYYFWAVGFFMAFNRHVGLQIELISETMAVNIFHFLQTQIDTWLSNMAIEKKKITLWSRRVHIALKAYKEMVLTLLSMISSDDEGVRRSAATIQSNIFYILEYRELVLVLFYAYQETKFSREYLKDLLETTHVFLKMLEHSCKHKKLVVQKHGRMRKAKSTKSTGKQFKRAAAAAADGFTDETWNDISPQISAIIQHPELSLPSTVPFDAASDLPIDEQRLEAMSTIKSMLKQQQLELALSMLRSSREVWPEDDVFGSISCPPEEELLILREIFLTSVLDTKVQEQLEVEEEDEKEEEEEQERTFESVNVEQSFQFINFMKKFLHQNVTKALSHLLDQYDLNSDYTNHCLVKMMHRIAVDCKMPAFLFQASIFVTFQKLLQKEEPRLKELTTFAKFIVRKFVSTSMKNRHVFMEVLFWKSVKDAYEIEEGYDSQPKGGAGAMRGTWQEHEEEELKRLFMEYEINKPDQEKVDWILDNLINKERTRKSVIKKLKELYLITSTKDLRSAPADRLRPPTNWSSDEEDQLKTLYQQIKDFHDPMTALRDRMQHKRSKNSILNKLLELGIISHKSQMYKKRTRKPDDKSSEFNLIRASSSSRSSSSSSSDSETESFYTNASLSSTIRNLMDAGLQAIVEWVKESLEETLADIDDDETDVPLVPIIPETQQGIEHEDVVNMLRSLGLKSPRENMEIYWRIPGVWNTNALRTRIEFLTKILNKKDPLQSSSDSSKLLQSQDKDVTVENKENFLKNSNEIFKSCESNNDDFCGTNQAKDRDEGETNVEENEHYGIFADQSKARRKRVTVNIDSSSSDNETTTDEDDIYSSSNKKNQKRMILNSDSDTDDKNGHEDKHELNKRTKNTSKRKATVLDSDSDSDEVIMRNEKLQSIHSFNSDSSEPSTIKNSYESKTSKLAQNPMNVSDSESNVDATANCSKGRDETVENNHVSTKTELSQIEKNTNGEGTNQQEKDVGLKETISSDIGQEKDNYSIPGQPDTRILDNEEIENSSHVTNSLSWQPEAVDTKRPCVLDSSGEDCEELVNKTKRRKVVILDD